MPKPKTTKPQQDKDPELIITKEYDYKLQIEKLSLRLYLHTGMSIGLMMILLGLVVYKPVPQTYALGIMIFGAFIVVTAWYYTTRLK